MARVTARFAFPEVLAETRLAPQLTPVARLPEWHQRSFGDGIAILRQIPQQAATLEYGRYPVRGRDCAKRHVGSSP